MSQPELNKTDTEKLDRRGLAELKNGKVFFKQKPVSFEKFSETMQEIVKFREMLEQHIQRGDPSLTMIPDEHKPLIVKLAHESDKTVTVLAKHIRQELLPSRGEDGDNAGDAQKALSALPLTAIENTIRLVMKRNNYGLDGPLGLKLPSAVCVWRWEVGENFRDWLPKSGREKAEARMVERVQAKNELAALFANLPQEERDAILDPKGSNALPSKESNNTDNCNVTLSSEPLSDNVKESTPAKAAAQPPSGSENDPPDDNTPKARSKKSVEADKATKEKERQEKKAAKAEKERKEKERQDKSRSLMANFFGKAKLNRESPSKDSNAMAGPSASETDFQKTFKPFTLKKGAQLAPINWFCDARQSPGKRKFDRDNCDVIVIDEPDTVDDEDIEMIDPVAVAQTSPVHEDDLIASLKCAPRPAGSPPYHSGRHSRSAFKTFNRYVVREIVSQLSEAEIAGEITEVRILLSLLKNRRLVPAKTLIFAGDARPGYFGTWTRNSRIVGPRTPFVRDALSIDYGYDSGEEWEEEVPGEADDVLDDDEEEGADSDEVDSDTDSWLVDDDEVEEVGTPIEERESSPLLADLPIPPPKRKADGERKLGKKRKVVVPLVPFAKGPCWEPKIGGCSYELFKPYRIQLFNDTSFPIDPFTFISNPIPKSTREDLGVSSQDVFVKPSLPRSGEPIDTFTSVINSKRTASAPVPKTTFPDTHIPLLLTKIVSLATGNITFIVESIYQDLRVQRVKKNAIEAKVREVAEKSKERKIWVIKDDVQARHGLLVQ